MKKLLMGLMVLSSVSVFGSDTFNAPVCEITVSGVSGIWVKNPKFPGVRTEKYLNIPFGSDLTQGSKINRFWRSNWGWHTTGFSRRLAKETYEDVLNYESAYFSENPAYCGEVAQYIIDKNNYLTSDQVTWIVKIAQKGGYEASESKIRVVKP